MVTIKKAVTCIVLYFWNNPLVLAFLMSASLLAGAYAFEYIGNMPPCDLCWTHRYAHMAILGSSAAGLFLSKASSNIYRLFGWLTVVALGTSAGVAGYHAGVEQKWWKGPSTCTASGQTQATDMDSLFDNMMTTRLVLCDEIPWQMFGISMAGYNFLISLATFVFSLFALVRMKSGKIA